MVFYFFIFIDNFIEKAFGYFIKILKLKNILKIIVLLSQIILVI